MKTIEHIEARLRELDEQLQPLLREKSDLQNEKRDAESLAFIKANGIKLGEIEFSSGTDLPYFGTVMEFAKHLAHCRKPWAEWNGLIYRSSDLILGRMPESPAIAEHVKI